MHTPKIFHAHRIRMGVRIYTMYIPVPVALIIIK